MLHLRFWQLQGNYSHRTIEPSNPPCRMKPSLTFWYEFASTYWWLAAERIEALAAQAGKAAPALARGRRWSGTSKHRHLRADPNAQRDGHDHQSYCNNRHSDEKAAVGPAPGKIDGIAFTASVKACHCSLLRGTSLMGTRTAASTGWTLSMVPPCLRSAFGSVSCVTCRNELSPRRQLAARSVACGGTISKSANRCLRQPDHPPDIGRRRPFRAQFTQPCRMARFGKLAAVDVTDQAMVVIDRLRQFEEMLEQTV
jgi:hypothetical protein